MPIKIGHNFRCMLLMISTEIGYLQVEIVQLNQ